jgi:hypothetical protein
MVLLGFEVIGGEIADTRFRIRRRVRADDPAVLGALLSYAVEVLAADDDDQDLEPAAAALSKSRQWVSRRCALGETDLRTAPRKECPHEPSASPRAPGGLAAMLYEWWR